MPPRLTAPLTAPYGSCLSTAIPGSCAALPAHAMKINALPHAAAQPPRQNAPVIAARPKRAPVPMRKVAEYLFNRHVTHAQSLGRQVDQGVRTVAHEAAVTARVAPAAVAQFVGNKVDALDAHLTAAVMNGAGLTDITRLPNRHKLSTTQTSGELLHVTVRDPLNETAPPPLPHSLKPGMLLAQQWANTADAWAQADALRQAGQAHAARQKELVEVLDTALYFVPWLGSAYGLGRLAHLAKSKLPSQSALNFTDRRATWVAQLNMRHMPQSWVGNATLPKAVKTHHVPDTFETLRTGGTLIGAGSVAATLPQHDLNVYLDTDLAHTLFNASTAARNVTAVFGDLSLSLWITPFNVRPPLLSGLDNHSNPYIFRDKTGFGYVDIPILGMELGAGWRLGTADYAIGTRFVARPGNVQIPISLERSQKEGAGESAATRQNKLVWRIGASLLHMGVYPTVFAGPANYGIRETASMSQVRGLVTRHGAHVDQKFENRNSSQEVLSINPAYGYGPIEAGKVPDFSFALRKWVGWSED